MSVPNEPQIKALVGVAMGRVWRWRDTNWYKPAEVHVNTLRGLLKNGLIELAAPEPDGAAYARLTEQGKTAVAEWNAKHGNSPVDWPEED